MQGESEIIKTDRKGRIRFNAQRRQELLLEFDRSGLTAPKFAEVTGLKYQTFAAWLQRRRRQGLVPSQAANKSVQWLETVLSAAAPAAGSLLMKFPGGPVLEVTTSSQALLAAELLRAWEKAGC